MKLLTLVDPVAKLSTYSLQIRAADWIGYRHEYAVLSRNCKDIFWTRAVYLCMKVGPEGDAHGPELQTRFALFGKKTIPSLYWAASKFLRGKSFAAWSSHKGQILFTSKGSYGDVPDEIRGCKDEARRDLQVLDPRYRKLLRRAVHAYRDSLVSSVVARDGTLFHGPMYRKHPKATPAPCGRRQTFNLEGLPRELVIHIIDLAMQDACRLSFVDDHQVEKRPTPVFDVYPTRLHQVSGFFREFAYERFWKLAERNRDVLPRCTVLKLFKMVFGHEGSDKWIARLFRVDERKMPGWQDAWDAFDLRGRSRCLCVRRSMKLVGFPLSESEL